MDTRLRRGMDARLKFCYAVRKRDLITISVPKSIHRMVIIPRGWGIPIMMNIKNGVISGMLLVNV